MENFLFTLSFVLGLTSAMVIGTMGVLLGIVKTRLNTYGGEISE